MDANDRRAGITREAARWWTHLGVSAPSAVSEADREEFTQWLRESPLHVAELLHIAHVHDAIEQFALWEEISTPTEHAQSNVIALAPGTNQQLLRQRPTTRWIVAACLCLVATAAGWISLHSNITTLETDRAERREVALSDGSVVSIGPETRLQFDLKERRRDVLLIRGRALFHVAKDNQRPFIVHAGHTNVRAVGTTFGIEQKGHKLIVTVSEGRVGIAPAAQRDVATSINPSEANDSRPPSPTGAGTSGEVLVSANQQVTVQTSGDASPVQTVDSSSALAWSEGRLVLDSTPLGEVVEEFNQYNRVQLLIGSPDLARRTISGVFRASDPETLIDFIAAGARVTVTRNGNADVVITSVRPDASTQHSK